MRVTDNMALMTTKTLYVSVSDAENAPKVSAIAEIESGMCPFSVVFDALLEGGTNIIRYEWDFDGDGLFDWESEHTPFAEHVFREPGVYSAKIKITGDDLLSADSVIEVRAEKNPEQLYPLSDFEINVSVGKAPLEVCFLELAFPAGGEIIKYEWDFDGDGKWDEVFETGSSLWQGNADTRFVYDEVGLYRAVLKVTDSEGFVGRSMKYITAISPYRRFFMKLILKQAIMIRRILPKTKIKKI